MRLALCACVAQLAFLLCARIASGQDPNGQVHGFVSFSTQRVEVDEDSGNAVTTVQLPLVREVSAIGTVLATVQVTNASASSDFFSSTAVVSFTVGVTSGSAVLLLQNDDTPEGNETFIVNITGTRFGAEIGPVNSLILVVRGSDEPHGYFQFAIGSHSISVEETTSGSVVELMVERSPGIFGRVTVDYTVVNGPGNGVDDISPTGGQLVFNDGVGTVKFNITITADSIPEDEESFMIELSNPTGGAGLAESGTEAIITINDNDTPIRFSMAQYTVDEDEGSVILTVTRGVLNDGVGTVKFNITITADSIPEDEESFTIELSNPTGGAGLAESGTEAIITINDNDTPIRFSMAQYTVDEDEGSVILTVTRGVLDDGTEIGNVTQESIVEYTTVPGTAESGTDYDTQSGTLTFASGVMSMNISVPILNDSDPEGDELFSISLSNPSTDAVLSTPLSATVLIEVNDNAGGLVQFLSAGPVVVSEDDGSTAEFIIHRLNGSYSDITIQWRIVDSSNELASDDFDTTSGNLTIADGETEGVLQIQPTNDDSSEIAERFSVELTGVIGRTGELQPMGIRVASLIIEDSDDVYGLVQLASDSQLYVTSGAPRQLNLAVTRSPGTTGTISVDYYVTYLPSGVSDPASGDSSVFAMAVGSERLVGGQMTLQWNVDILSGAFLDPNGTFYISLNSTTLVEGVVPLVTPTNSPHLGSRSDATISIPITAANGYISFSQSTFTTQEPDTSFGDSVALTLTRTGAYGNATVTWRVISITTDSDDLGTSTGMTQINNGSIMTSSDDQVVVVILNDEDPEVDETFEVQLVSVAESGQRIDPEHNTSVVTIELNDNADGIFTVSSSQSSYTIAESSQEVITITILRTGGSLTSQTIQYQTLPGSGADFIGGVNMATFLPGITEMEVYVLPNDDNIPENTEEFNFTISASNSDLLGNVTSIGITIEANDEYVGVFSFSSSSLLTTIDEPGLEGVTSTATLTVIRSRGTFTDVTVYWEIDGSEVGDDVIPTSGNITFFEEQNSATFSISATPDEMPENDIHYTVVLVNVSGDGELATSSIEATVTVRHNDDPINFRNNSLEASEGETVQLVVSRGGHTNGVAVVSYQVNYTSASTDDVAISPTGQVRFKEGEDEAIISVMLIDDDIPEETEQISISLTSTTGDAVLVTPTVAVINILPSDDPNGEFVFRNETIFADEGDILNITVDRLQGTFGTVEIMVKSYILNTTTGDRISSNTSSDIHPTSELLVFEEDESYETFTLEIINEKTPEFEEQFELALTIISSTGDSADGAKIGSPSSSTITVSENDDPRGLFIISSDTNDVEVAEDVGEGEEGGSVDITILRDYGVSGHVEVVWELVPELYSPLPRFTDCLFLRSRGSEVSDISPRNYTGTTALQFFGNPDSIVTVASEHHPPIISNEFTISLWISMTGGSTGGVLLAKATDSGSTVFYGLRLQPNGGDFLIRLLYLPASRTTGSESVEVSIAQSSIADGDWHSLSVSVNNNVATFYLDAVPINSRTLEESSIRDGPGELTVGGIPGVSNSPFTGGLQDVRVYAASLDQSQISAVATDDVASTLTPISGYLIYQDGDEEFEITLSTVEDEIPEPSTFYQLQLTSSNGGSRIDYSANSARVTVLKSDAANGVFGFQPSSLSNTIDEGGSILLTVERSHGDYGNVTVDWEIRSTENNSLATSDFSISSGYLHFADGIRQMTLSIQPVDEVLPELDEHFVILLTNATSNDGFTSSTPTSGSFINSSFDQSNLTVTENDYPYGLLQFSTTIPPSSGLILATDKVPELSVRESAGSVTIYVVRAQGTLGTLGVEYLTSAGNATGTGITPDYVPSAGLLTFGPDDRYMSVNLTLIDDERAEREKVFYVGLNNPTGDEGVPGLSIGRNITIRILPSDHAFGLFVFTIDSLSRLVSEQEGGTEVTLSVRRLGGSFDDVSVYWEVDEGHVNDINPSFGHLDFPEGVVERELTVNVTDDQDPELEEGIFIRLLNATGGATVTTNGSQVATVTVRASNHPYGLFGFSTGFRPLVVDEDSGEVEVMVIREFGDLGRVTVNYMTIESDHSYLQGLINVDQLQENSKLADAGQDYREISSGAVVFEEYETEKSFSLTIHNDGTPEVDEYIFIAITSVTLDPDSVDDVDYSVLPTNASGNGSLAFIVIAENDDARGVLQLSSSTYEAQEPSQSFITVNRTTGHFGTVTVYWEAVAITAQSSDFTPQNGTVILNDGDLSAQLQLSITDDSDPEFSETLSVTLISTGGGARLEGTLLAVVTILASDDPNGALQFAVGSRAVQVTEPDGPGSASVSLVVERDGGTSGVVEVTWTITSGNGDEPSLDIVPVFSTLQYISSVRLQTITLSINPDNIPEVAEVFTISLSGATGGARVGEFSTATVTIRANDNPNGFVSLENPTIVTTEDDDDSIIIVPIVRSGGLFRTIQVFYNTNDVTATGDIDYESLIGSSSIIESGESSVNVSVTILADDTPELNETFQFALLSVIFAEDLPENSGEDGPQLGETISTEITIVENDDPYGRFSISGAGRASVVRVPEVENLGVSLTVRRDAGRVGTVSVTWNMTGGTAVEDADFAGSGSVLTFSGDTTQRTISLTILHDDLPERDEDIVISLTSPTGGAVLARDGSSMVTVIIEANDNAAGIVRLTNSSRSVIVQEGQNVMLELQRNLGNLGVVEVSWEIYGTGNVSIDFRPASGTTMFQDGSSMAEIVFHVSEDGNAELSEVYHLNLTGVQTLSEDISEMGVAELESGATMVTITVGASDHPHGVVEFQEVSLETQFHEGMLVSLTIVREFGTVGAIDVVYQAVMGNLTPLSGNTSLATPGSDFITSNGTITLEDGQTSATLNAPIIVDDTDAELSEVFLIELISVTLDSDENGEIPPSIGDNYQVQVTIPPNDNPEGILNFEQTSVIVSEDSGTMNLRVRRDQGTVGRVSALVIFTDRGATIGEDYSSTQDLQDLVFESGESERMIPITIIDDNVPELAETFCIRLITPEGNVEIGDNDEVCVVIQLNDDADRHFSFDSDSLFSTLDEAGDIVTSENVAVLRVIRRGVITGDVTIPFEIEESGRDDLTVTPSSGILIIQEEENVGIIRVTAVSDDMPELNETYNIYLLDPEAANSTAVNLTASITIRANQNPHGLLEIHTIDGVSSEISVEEDVRYLELEIERANGSFGEISVDLNTVAGTAISPLVEGSSLSFSVTEFLDTIGARKWYQFMRDGTQYLFLASSSEIGNSVLYEWRGVFVPIQTLDTRGASAATYFSVDDRDILIVSNYGTSGERDTNSTVYQFSETGQLEEIQSIATEGASDVTSLLAPNGVWYLIIASREDSNGSPNVDSIILEWRNGRFEVAQLLETIGASAVDVVNIENTPYLIFTSFTDTRSRVYIWSNNEFRLDHNIDTAQATDVKSARVNGVLWLAIAMGSNGVSLFQWSSVTRQFVLNSTISKNTSIQVEFLPESDLLLVTNSEGPGQLYSLTDLTEIQEVNLPEAAHLYPITVGSEQSVYIAVAINALSGAVEQSSIGQLQQVGVTTDFYPRASASSIQFYYTTHQTTRSTTLTFHPGETSYNLVVEIIDDSTPELDEEFAIQLSNPTGGAVLGSLSSFLVTVRTNDDAYGLIGFSEDSLSVVVPETESSSQVVLTVSRDGGTFGRVVASWQITGDHSTGEISPTSGEVVFDEGDVEYYITLTVHPDLTPEFDEVTVVELTEITNNGVPPGSDDSRGARLVSGRTLAAVTVEANDAPHGVLVWMTNRVQTPELDGMEGNVELTIVREFGTAGSILIFYSTSTDSNVPEEERATPGTDYVPVTNSIIMADNTTASTISITILHDNDPEQVESFAVSLVNVTLINDADRQGTNTNSPRVDPNLGTAIVEITENDNSRGILQFSMDQIMTSEDIGTIQIEVVRSRGLFGRVAVDFSVTGLTATSDDFSPQSGTVEFDPDVSSRNISIDIINDSDPELEESFVISLVNPQDGATIGDANSIIVTIDRNDDINGVFSFETGLFQLTESEGSDGLATLTVQRSRSTVGDVTVYWAVSEDGVNDLEPTSGNLTFREGESEHSFQIRAIVDGLPELFESPLVELVSTVGGGRIVEPSEARIAIQASDNPNGVVGFDNYPSGIILNEGDLLTFRILRTAGLFGEVSVTWRISPSDTGVFTTTSTTVTFADGQSEAAVTVQTIVDDIPETARLFSLDIESTVLAVVNESLHQADIIVAASNDPHGVVEFGQPSAVSIQEAEITLSIPIERHNGLVGDLTVNSFVLSSSTATDSEDYVFLNQSIVILANDGSSDLVVTIIDDNIAELAETLSLSLLSVELTQDIDGGRDFNFSGDPAIIDQYPRLGAITMYTVTIEENDDPYGVVSLTDSVIVVNEGEIAVLMIGRSGGTFGLVILEVSITPGSADDSDFTDVSGSLVRLVQEQRMTTINIPINNDEDPELQEDFTVSITLSSSSSPARIGAITSTTVVIDSSDSPHGDIGFQGDPSYTVPNPSTTTTLTLLVQRTGGRIGQTEVVWEVVGPYPGHELSDISPTGNTLILQDGQGGSSINLNILSTVESDEEAKTFTVTLLSASNDVQIDPERQSITITVQQKGMPYGTIGFFGEVLQLHKVDEGDGHQTVIFPIARTAPALGDITVPFIVIGVNDASLDVYPASGTVVMGSGLTQVDLQLEILDDTDPELEETFTVFLSDPLPANTSSLDSLAAQSTFTIRANDAPYGRFIVTLPSLTVDSSLSPEISRTFSYTIERDNGLIGAVLLTVITTYTPDPDSEYVEQFTGIIQNGQQSLPVQLPVSTDSYIAPGATFTVTISNISLQNQEAQEGSSPEVGGTAELVVTENVANAEIGFSATSLEATVNDETNGVVLTVVRRGDLGTVMVYWTAGLPSSSIANGSITPEQGSFQMNPDDTSSQILLTAIPLTPHGVLEVFAVTLTVEPVVPASLPAAVNHSTATAFLEPSGVIQLAYNAFSGVENSGNILVEVQRYYGSRGDIQVFGTPMMATNTSIPANQEPAIASIDYADSQVQVVIPDGSTSGVLSVPIFNNQESGPLKVFQLILTSVVGESEVSPRLSTTGILTALLTIIDDEAGAGLFRLQPTSDRVEETAGRVSFSVSREGGSQGRVTVLIETVEGNPASQSRESATDGSDFTGIAPREVVFEDGDSETKIFTIALTDDALPEVDEQFTVVLSNPPGGSALIDPEADSLVVTIAANDNPGGVFSITPATITLSEESAPTGTLTVQRTGGTLTEVIIEWEALYTDGEIHSTAISSILGIDRATLVFPIGVTSIDINLALQLNSVPVNGEVFTIRIQSDSAGIEFSSETETIITVLAMQSSLFQIAAPDIWKVVTESGATTVGVERVNGTQLMASVQYATVEFQGNTTVGQLTLLPAQFGVHYTGTSGSLAFVASEISRDISVNVIDTAISYPRAFSLVISTSEPHNVRNSEATVVLSSPGPLSYLIDIYFDTLESTTTAQIESVANRLFKLMSEGALIGSSFQFVNGQEQLQFDVTQYVLRGIINRASGQYTNSLTANISDIFQLILGDESFAQRSEIVQTMQLFAYSLLDGEPCSNSVPVTKTLSRLLFHLVAERVSPSILPQRRFTASFDTEDDDYIKFPKDSIFPGSSLAGVECVDVHYIELVEERILQESTLDGKVLSIGIRGQSVQTQSPILYRIYTDSPVMPLENDCLLWNRTLKSWDDKTCKVIRNGLLPVRDNYVECECHRLGEFAIVNDVERGFGWTLSGGLVAAFVAVVTLMVICVHVCYFQRTQLVTRIFVMLCVSVLLYQVMLLVAVFASDRPDTTESGCTAIAIMLHFTVILQFVWILALAVSLWTNFMGITDGKEPLIIYTIVCLVVAILWIVVTILIGRFGLSDSLKFTDVYGLTGDFCYTPELSVSLVSTLLPVVLAILATAAFFSHSCIYWSRWEDFHNMYLDSFNKTEIPLLLMFFATVFVSGISAFVHLYARQVYTYGIFVTLEFFQGLYTLIVYVFLSWHTLTRKHRKYGIDDEVEPLTVPGEPDFMGSMNSLASSTRRLDIQKREEEEEGEWQGSSKRETDSDEDSSGTTSEGAPPIPLALRPVPSEDTSLEGDDSQLDDLMFMLKTQNLPEGDDDTAPFFPESPRKLTTSEHLELRRISIADTHL